MLFYDYRQPIRTDIINCCNVALTWNIHEILSINISKLHSEITDEKHHLIPFLKLGHSMYVTSIQTIDENC